MGDGRTDGRTAIRFEGFGGSFLRVFEGEFADSGYVGEYGGTQASSDDQPVCFDSRLRRGPGEAAFTSGPLAV